MDKMNSIYYRQFTCPLAVICKLDGINTSVLLLHVAVNVTLFGKGFSSFNEYDTGTRTDVVKSIEPTLPPLTALKFSS